MTKSESKLLIGALPNRPTEIWRMSADNKRAKDLLNWEPKISFEKGILKTIDWYKKFIQLYHSNSGLREL